MEVRALLGKYFQLSLEQKYKTIFWGIDKDFKTTDKCQEDVKHKAMC